MGGLQGSELICSPAAVVLGLAMRSHGFIIGNLEKRNLGERDCGNVLSEVEDNVAEEIKSEVA